MKNRKRFLLLRKDSVRQIIAYLEIKKRETTILGNSYDKVIEKPKAVIVYQLVSNVEKHTVWFKNNAELNDWLDNFQSELDNIESGNYIRLNLE